MSGDVNAAAETIRRCIAKQRLGSFYFSKAELDAAAALVAEVESLRGKVDSLQERVDMARKRDVAGEASLKAASATIDQLRAERDAALAANDGKADLLVHDALIEQNEALRVEKQQLEERCKLESEQAAKLRYLLAKAEAREQRLQEALRECEWGAYRYIGEETCPVCAAERKRGHAADCIVGAALTTDKETPPCAHLNREYSISRGMVCVDCGAATDGEAPRDAA